MAYMMKTFKEYMKRRVPRVYWALTRTKDFFFAQRWGNYYDGSDPDLQKPERCLLELQKDIPSYITTILNLGCGAGRDFIPFDGKLALWGIDIVPLKRIHWVRAFQNLRYEHCSVEKLTRRLERGRIDLSNTLVFGGGTLMYVSSENQKRFWEACRASGCRNFIFQEFRPGSPLYPTNNFQIPVSNFQVQYFRKEGAELPTYFSFAHAHQTNSTS